MRLLVCLALLALTPGLAAAAASKKASPAHAKSPARPSKADTSSIVEHDDPTRNRRLQDIHIEGEIPVPQVLFITAREQRRVLDFDHKRYRRSSVELARGTAVPKRVTVAKPPAAPATTATPAEGSK